VAQRFQKKKEEKEMKAKPSKLKEKHKDMKQDEKLIKAMVKSGCVKGKKK
jgi:hypothetical protein